LSCELDETHIRESIILSFSRKKAIEGKVRHWVTGLSHGHETR
jgi:hypothetical protein